MAENSAISWTRHTWNPWMGCTKISPACDGCYAEALMDKRYHKVEWGNAPRVRTGAHTWNDPFRWQRQAEKDGDRPFVFCASLADIFDNQVDPQWRADAFEVMRKTPRLVYLLLTKRPQNIVKLSEAASGLPSNAAIGATIEDQKRADLNVTALLEAKGRVKPAFAFLSCEPLLGPIDLTKIVGGYSHPTWRDALSGRAEGPPNGSVGGNGPRHFGLATIDWVITGGETDQGGHKSRPSHPDWYRALRDQCEAAGVPYHHKQNGEWSVEDTSFGAHEQFAIDHDGNVYSSYDIAYPDGARRGEIDSRGRATLTVIYKVGKKNSGRVLDGVTHDAFPEVAP